MTRGWTWLAIQLPHQKHRPIRMFLVPQSNHTTKSLSKVIRTSLMTKTFPFPSSLCDLKGGKGPLELGSTFSLTSFWILPTAEEEDPAQFSLVYGGDILTSLRTTMVLSSHRMSSYLERSNNWNKHSSPAHKQLMSDQQSNRFKL